MPIFNKEKSSFPGRFRLHFCLHQLPQQEKPGKVTPGPIKKSNHSSLLISATVGAFRGHGFSLLVTAFLRGLQLMLFPQKSPPTLQSTNIDGNYDYRLVLSLA